MSLLFLVEIGMAEVQTNSRRGRRCFCLVGINYRYSWELLVQNNVSEIGTATDSDRLRGWVDDAKWEVRRLRVNSTPEFDGRVSGVINLVCRRTSSGTSLVKRSESCCRPDDFV